MTDLGAVVPLDYQYKPIDHGIHAFHVTLSALGSQTITATDTGNRSITGHATTNVILAPAATHFAIYAPKVVLAGSIVYVTVAALDAQGNPTTNYSGLLDLNSSDPKAPMLGSHQFVAADHGRFTFKMSMQTPGLQNLIAMDSSTGLVMGQKSMIVDSADAALHFAVAGFPAKLGSPTMFSVSVMDAQNHVVAGYTGTVMFTSSDGKATLPGHYTFQTGSNGHSSTFWVTFRALGNQTITVTDMSNSSRTGKGTFVVSSTLF
jgi:hypothetical protein